MSSLNRLFWVVHQIIQLNWRRISTNTQQKLYELKITNLVIKYLEKLPADIYIAA